MPIYEYQCEDCDKIFEYLTVVSGDVPVKCELCGSEKKPSKVLSTTNFKLKGSGFHSQDYPNRRPTADTKPKRYL